MKIKALKKERTTIKEAIEAWSRRYPNDTRRSNRNNNKCNSD